VPLPEHGGYRDTSLFTLKDISGTIIPCEFRIASKWLNDSSTIRWLHLDFQSTINANQSRQVVLHQETSPYSATGDLAVQDLGDKLQVTNTLLKFIVKKSNYNIIDELWIDESGSKTFDAAHKIIASHNRGLIHRLGAEIYTASNNDSTQVSVERLGPMSIVIKAEGYLKNSLDSASFYFISRIYAYNNSKILKIENTIEHHNGVQSAFKVINSLCMELPLSLGAGPTVLVGKPGGYEQAILSAADTAYALSKRPAASFTDVELVLGSRVNGRFYPKQLKSKDVGWASLYNGQIGKPMAMER
jgi:hypothetical protein